MGDFHASSGPNPHTTDPPLGSELDSACKIDAKLGIRTHILAGL